MGGHITTGAICRKRFCERAMVTNKDNISVSPRNKHWHTTNEHLIEITCLKKASRLVIEDPSHIKLLSFVKLELEKDLLPCNG